MSAIRLLSVLSCFFLYQQWVAAQHDFTRNDTLRGTITKERVWWNALHYDLEVTPDFNTKGISGIHTITFETLSEDSIMQIDLQKPMRITSAKYENSEVYFSNEENVWYLHFPKPLTKGDTVSVIIHFEGKPRAARIPPWDGGAIWKTDANGRPWMSVACQGLGASVWYPCKDHQSDEPDLGALISISAPEALSAVSNGKLISKIPENNGTNTWVWEVKNPINAYNIIPYIGYYSNWTDSIQGANGTLDLDFWVLDYEVEKAKVHFQEVKDMLQCFEQWFGPYPFYEDGYKLIQSPHLGMEHQSAIAYGNAFKKGYLGSDLSGTGWGMKWDFIIIHESGHEWFGNSITTKDIADMWVHEGFTAYSETIYTQCQFGTEAGNDYVIGTREKISNKKPIIGPYGVNVEGSGDMYYKGANMIHTIRQLFPSDEAFQQMLVDLNVKFFHSTVTTAQVENFISERSGRDLSKVFDQYLRQSTPPVIEYYHDGKKLIYRWAEVLHGFDMPLKMADGNWLFPTTTWQETIVKGEFVPDRNFYVLLLESKK